MNETAYILNTATSKSLVIMDEVGRGTGTQDGLSIAWAVSEDLLDRVECRTLFATHYHELSRLDHPRLANRSMEVLDQGGKIVFLRKLKEGPSAESYGLHVARLAGISESLLERADLIMQRMQDREAGIAGSPPEASSPVSAAEDRRFLAEISSLDPNAMTPLEALHLIAVWKVKYGSVPCVKDGKSRASHPVQGSKTQDPLGPGLFDS
jgi:DNA mismatch repair protein MutS